MTRDKYMVTYVTNRK